MASVYDDLMSGGAVDLRLLEIPALVRQRWRTLAITTTIFVVVVGLWLLVKPSIYTVNSAFVPTPQTSDDMAGVSASFAAGLNGADLSPDRSPALYVDLLRSRQLFRDLARVRVSGAHGDSGTIAQGLGIQTPDSALLRERTADALEHRVHSSLTLRTGVVRLSVSAPAPQLALAINKTLLHAVDSFNIVKLQDRGALERRFTQQRIGQVKTELRDAENRLQSFMDQNRAYSLSSILAVQHDRLEREVTLKQAVLATLTTQLARAEEDAQRDTPVITVLENPELPPRADGRGVIALVLLAAIGGCMSGVLIAFVMAARVAPRTGIP